MSVKHLIQRTLMDGDDRQTMRSWSVEIAGAFLTIRNSELGEPLLIVPFKDIPLFMGDLETVKRLSETDIEA